jgi:hypothetical protein
MKGKCIVCETEFKYYPSQRDGKYCSRKCCTDHQRLGHDDKFERGELKDRGALKRRLVESKGRECETCGLSEWMGKKIPIEIDHIDGNATNNHPSNLRLLCSNCHAQTPTHRGFNRGFGRKSRGLNLWN